MANRNIPIMMNDGKEYMMTEDEAKAYYNSLPRTDEAAGIFPVGRYMQLLKQSPKAASTLLNWYKNLQPNKWGTKIFPGVSNLNVPATTSGVPAVVEQLADKGIKLSNKAKMQLGGLGLAGTAGMGIGAYNADNNESTIVDNNVIIDDAAGGYYDPADQTEIQNLNNAVPADVNPQIQALYAMMGKDGIPIADVGKITPDVYAAGSDKAYKDMGINGGVNNALIEAAKIVDAATPKVNPQVAKLANLIQVTDKPKGAVVVKREPVISSDPGYVNGYKVDKVSAGSNRAGKAIHDALMGLNAGAYGADDEYGVDY